MAVRWLLALCSCATRRKDSIKQKSPLLDLPLDIVHAIFDELPLHAMVLLSQSCRDLRLLLGSRCYSAVREASAADRLEFLGVLGDILPDHRLCTHCRALHLVDPKDLPVTDCGNYYKPCPAPESTWSRHRLHPYYAVAHRHVQLAIKYTRLEHIHQSYRASILQRFTISLPRFYSMSLEFTAEPAVIHGRFILMTTFTYHKVAAPLSFTTLSHAAVRICPHLGIGETVSPENPLLAVTRSAFRVGLEVHSCDRCPTDCLIIIRKSRATFYAWQDLGSGTSPMDPYWRSHILDLKNNQFIGTKFCYKHGSIRDMYYSNGTRS
jgi:hypothetical protein